MKGKKGKGPFPPEDRRAPGERPMEDRRQILKKVPKLRKIKPAKPQGR